MQIRRLARAAAWTAAGGVLVILALATVMVAINWRDETPSPDAVRLQAVIDGRPAVPDRANAFVFVLGLAAPSGEDPVELGGRRKAFLGALPPMVDPSVPFAAFPGTDVDYQDARSPAVRELERVCRQGSADCALRLERQAADIDRWLASEGWLLERYLQLVQRDQWVEAIPTDPAAPMARYQDALAGQKLLLMKAWRLARDGRGEAARALLRQDLAFWRMVLRSSDILISKMIATAAIDRHFSMGNLVVRALQASGDANAIPESWRQPIGREERSMLRALAGEWRFSTGVLEAHGARAPALKDRLMQRMFQPQATRNLFAGRMVRVATALDVDFPELPRAAAATASASQGGLLRLYNPLGHVLAAIGPDSEYLKYGLRVSDLEGTRRAVLLAAQLRADRTEARAAPSRIRTSTLNDPYTGAAFEWHDATCTIVFAGLESGPRGRHAVLL